MKKFLKSVVVVVVVLLIALIVLSLSLGTIIEKGVATVGPKVMGVPVAVEDVGFNLFSGKANIDNLVVGNPEGYHSEYAFKLGKFVLDIDMGSVLSDKVLIRKILIDGPAITYELGLKGTNLAKLQKQIKERSSAKTTVPETGEAPAASTEKDAGGKKVEITELIISGGQINLSATALGGSQVPIPLPTLRLVDLGKEKEGASVADVVEEILTAVVKAAAGTVKGSGELLGKGLKASGDLAADGVKMGADAAAEGAEAATELAGKGAEAATELAGKSAEAAGEAAEQVGDALGKGADAAGDAAKKLLGGLKGLGRGGE